MFQLSCEQPNPSFPNITLVTLSISPEQFALEAEYRLVALPKNPPGDSALKFF